MPAAPAPGPVFQLYAALTAVAAPAIRIAVSRRMRKAGVTPVRIAERFGEATEARHPGRLIWFHAASVGEALSILGLVHEMGLRDHKAHFLITSVSATSAKLVSERRPPRCAHQFAPLDTPGAVARFLDHWQPDLAVFVESELWPRLIFETHARGVPLALVNARLSERSFVRWQRLGRVARAVLARFSVLIAQTEATRDRLAALGAPAEALSVSGDLKAASDRLPIDEDELARLEAQIGGRRLWVAASTHPGEEAMVAEAVAGNGLLILAPRHPERGDEVAALLRGKGLTVAQRSKQEVLGPETDVYLADTLGELGLWYALAPVVFLGGSLVEIGGHNPFEPAQFRAAILHGPHVVNFRETYAEMTAMGAAREVTDAASLTTALHDMAEPETLRAAQEAAHAFSRAREGIRNTVADRLMPLLDGGENG